MPYQIKSTGSQMIEQHPNGHIYLHRTDSTNKEIWRMIDAGGEPIEFTVVQAGYQSAGRGLGSTVWDSEAGKNLLFSILLKPRFLMPSGQFILNKCIALAIRDALASVCPTLRFTIKWPNDILAGDGKIAGTLIENRITGKQIEYSVAGIGININQQAFPPDIPNPVSLQMLTGKTIDPVLCMHAVVRELKARYERLRSGHTVQTGKDYLAHLLGYQEERRFLTGNKVISGTITGVDAFGRLQLDATDGEKYTFDMKEIRFL